MYVNYTAATCNRNRCVIEISLKKVLDQQTVDTQCSRRDTGGFLVLNQPLQVKRYSRMKFGTVG